MTAILVRLPGAPPIRRDLPAPLVVGGSHADTLHLPGFPAAALRLLPCAAGVVVEAAVAGVHAGGHLLHPGGRRLVRPGESATLLGATLEIAPAPVPEKTRAAAAALLRDAAAGTAAPPGLHVLVLTGPAAGARHGLGAAQTVGRGRSASIVLPDPTASRIHARLTLDPAGAHVEDLQSKNGVRVNGVRIEPRPHPVRAGDELTIGETTLALTRGAAEPSTTPPQRPRGRRAPLVAAALLALSAAALALAAG
jgi:hypothetical protein